MPFSQSTISDVRISRDGAELYVAWTSSAPWGTAFQVYLDRRLAWSGTARSCNVPSPGGPAGRNAWIELGTVAAGETNRDFSASLAGPAGAGNRAHLSWSGGTYLDPTGRDDVRGFRIFRSAAPGGPVDFSKPVAVVAAYPGGAITDGLGVGGFGRGGFGRSEAAYDWYSGPLDSGTWSFAIAPYDWAGNTQGAPSTVGVTIAAAPRPPAADGNGSRLNYSFAGPANRLATLNWLASPTISR